MRASSAPVRFLRRPTAGRLAALGLLLALAAPAAAQDLFVAGGTLVDPRTREMRETGLLIVDGVIRGTAAAPPAGFRGTVVDARGRWVIPGLHDLHVHSLVNYGPARQRELVGSEVMARRMLWAGVTGFLDLFNEEDYVLDLRDRLREEGASATAADLYAAGPCLTATGGHCTQYPAPTRTIDSPEEARRVIADLAPRRPDVIKVVYDARPFPTIDEATLAAALAAAAEHGIPSVVHVGNWEEARAAARAGATALTHVDAERPMPEDHAAFLAARGTFVIPTLALHAGLHDLTGERGLWRSPLLQAVAPARLVDAYRTFDREGSRLYDILSAGRPAALDAVGRLAAAGVPIVAGTDSGNIGTVHGFSLHHELVLLVEAGLDPWQALAAATTMAGDLLGRGWGLSPGDEGSVVVLAASPIADIGNTQRIVEVVHHGHLVDREALARSFFPSAWSREVAAVAWAHVGPKHVAILALLLAVLAAVVLGTARLARRVRRRRARGSAPAEASA